MKRLKAAAVAVAALLVGLVLATVTGAFAVGTTAGSLALQPGMNMGVSCPNGLSNSGKTTHAETVQCAQNATTSTTAPATTSTTAPATTSTTAPATTSTTAPAPTTTVPSSGGGSFSCSVSGTNDYCPGPGQDYNYPAVSLNNGSNIYANTDVFNPPPGFTGQPCQPGSATPCQTLQANDPGNWQVNANFTDQQGAVLSGVQMRVDLGFQPFSGFSHITASSTDNLNANSGTEAEFGYDVWSSTSSGSAFSQEMMVWTDTVNRGTCGGATVVATGVQIGGQSWNLCVNGPNSATSEWIWYLPGAQTPSNNVDLHAMYQYMIDHGHYSASSGLNQIDETFEICSTGGQYETFTASGLTINAG